MELFKLTVCNGRVNCNHCSKLPVHFINGIHHAVVVDAIDTGLREYCSVYAAEGFMQVQVGIERCFRRGVASGR
jgi:hypothetical protein